MPLVLPAAAAVIGLAVATVTGGVTLAHPADPQTADPQTADPQTADPQTGDPDPGDPSFGERVDAAPTRARQAIALAGERLMDAGTFTYRGTVEANQASGARPGVWVAAEVTVEGEVELPVRSHEVATDADGRVSETVTEHVVVWGRQASDLDSLDGQTFEVVAETRGAVSAPSGAALLPSWLTASTDRTENGTDPDGRRRYRATVPGTAFLYPGAGGAAADADIVLTVDDAGDPVHVELMSHPGGPLLAVDLDIDDIGEPVTVELPSGRPTSVAGDVTPEQVLAAGISAPTELGALPEDWILYSTGLATDSPRAGCTTLELLYQDATTTDPTSGFLALEVTPAGCSVGDGYEQPVTLGSFAGTASVDSDGVLAEVTDGRITMQVLTDLPVEDVDTLFESIEPFDPATQPGSISGIPSS